MWKGRRKVLTSPIAGKISGKDRTLARRLARLDLDAPSIDDTRGKRETHNASRVFFSGGGRRADGCEAGLAEAFQDDATVGLLADRIAA